ncbi:MAG: HAD-IA family hydrolase [Coriobacteriales bacterium]|jgi:putative hydrolase of the HAD superfamily|nr:HAD-IA family hydrolase [Coriobacteriales bacterium]
MTIKAVFFDVGQTLLSPAPDGEAFCATANSIGIKLTKEMVLEHTPAMYQRYEQHYLSDSSFWDDHLRARAVWLDAYGLLYRLLGLEEQAEQLALMAYQFYFNPGAWHLYDDVLATLTTLQKRGIKLGLISNWDSSLIPVIEGLGISEFFSTIIASADVGMHKPEPGIFKLALDRLQVQADEALHVGDHITADVEGARSAGLHAVLIDRNNRHPEYREVPRITGLEPLPQMVE